MKKKILSLVLVVAMLASMLVFAPTAGATGAEVVIETTTAEGSVGDTVSVDVVVHYNGLIYGGQFAYEYDATKLQLNEITRPDGASGELSNKASATFGAAVAEGPYDVIVSTYTKSFDATEGVVMATLNFTILEGASGEAVVSVRNIMRDPQYPVTRIYNSATDTSYTADIECVAGGVTVLPEGYTSLEPTDASKFAFVEDKVDEYLGEWGGTIVIPDSATSIGNKAFAGAEANTTVIVPASVTYLEDGAFRRPAAGVTLTVIFLGDILGFEEIDETPFATRNSNGPIVVKSAPGSMVANLIADEEPSNVTWEAPSDISLTVGDDSYFVPSGTEIKAPGVATTDDGKVVVGWKSNDGTKTYAAGAAMTLTEDTKLNPVTINAIQMNTGVGFKMGATIDKCQMRYTTDMAIADYNTLASLGTVTLGTIITPAKYVSMAGGLTKEALTQLAIDNAAKLGALPDGKTGAGLTYIDVPASAANPYKETTDTYTFAGSLAGFKNENVNTKNVVYAAAFYATVELADGSSFTIYSNFDFGANRSVGDAITAMTNVEGGLTNPQVQTLRELIAGN